MTVCHVLTLSTRDRTLILKHNICLEINTKLLIFAYSKPKRKPNYAPDDLAEELSILNLSDSKSESFRNTRKIRFGGSSINSIKVRTVFRLGLIIVIQ